MALSRTAVLLLLLPVPGVVYLAASMEDVSASSQCLPSAEAVRKLYPGSWASWSTHVANHRGERCWFPAARETHVRHVEAALRRVAHSLIRRDAKEVKSRHDETSAGVKAAAAPPAVAETPVVYAVHMNDLGWNFRARSATLVGPGSAVSGAVEAASSSFEDRFDAARNVPSVQRPSVIQRMMDPVGAIPNMP